MIRNVILASVLAFVGCVDQGQPTVGATDQDSTVGTTAATTYTNIVPVWWSARYVSNSAYWDFGIPGTATINLQMTAFIVNGEAATVDPLTGRVTDPATRMVWLISNSGVYKVYEVYVSDVAQMSQLMRNAFTNVENSYAAQGYQAPGSSIIVGVDGGVVGGGVKGGGPPHGFPAAVVQSMLDVASTVRTVIVTIPNIGANSLH